MKAIRKRMQRLSERTMDTIAANNGRGELPPPPQLPPKPSAIIDPTAQGVVSVSAARSGLTLVSRSMVLLTHLLATKLLEMKVMLWERPLSEPFVAGLVRDMRNGMFTPEHVLLGICHLREDGCDYRANSQHNCWARLEVPEEEVQPMLVTLLTYDAVTMDDLRQCYAIFDRGRSRTPAVILDAYLLGKSQFGDVSGAILRHLARGLSFWLWATEHERIKHSTDEVASLMQGEHRELTNRVLTFCNSDPKLVAVPHMRRQPVVGAMYATFAKDQEAALKFWDAVRVGVGFKLANDPRLRLRTMLTNTVLQSGPVVGRDKNLTKGEAMYRIIGSAWRAWRRGEDLQVLRTTKERQPFI